MKFYRVILICSCFRIDGYLLKNIYRKIDRFITRMIPEVGGKSIDQDRFAS